MGAGAANPLTRWFREKGAVGKLEALHLRHQPRSARIPFIAGEMGFGMDAQQYLMGYLPVDLHGRERHAMASGRSTRL